MPHLHLGQVFWPQPLGDSGMFGISPFLEARCTKVPLGRQRLRYDFECMESPKTL